MPSKKLTNKETVDSVEIIFSVVCDYAGKERKVGDKVTVTKAHAKALAERGLINKY